MHDESFPALSRSSALQMALGNKRISPAGESGIFVFNSRKKVIVLFSDSRNLVIFASST